MPVVNEYKGRDGFYIRSAKGGSISTYQVTAEGRDLLRSNEIAHGDSISHADLDMLASRGLVYTNGGGPGLIESIEPVSIGIGRRASTESGSRPRNSEKSDAAGCAVAAVLLAFFGLAALVEFLEKQPASTSVPLGIGLGILAVSVLVGMVSGSIEKSLITFITLGLLSVAAVALYKICMFIGTWSLDVWVLLAATASIVGTFWWLSASLQRGS